MPEGDTIHRHARELGTRFGGRAITRLLRGGVAEPRYAGAELVAADAIGKHLVLRFVRSGEAEPDVLLVRVHLGIAGGWRTGPLARFSLLQRSAAPLLLDFGDTLALVHKPKEIVLERAGLADKRPLTALGPDLLGPAPDLDEVLRRARVATYAAAPLGELLLDQRVAAGIGNVYKSEVCFLECLHPFLRVDEVDDATLRRSYERAIVLLGQNLGSWRRTTTADRSRDKLPARGQGRYWVYGRDRRPCYTCGTVITRRVMGPDLRSTFFCGTCQAP